MTELDAKSRFMQYVEPVTESGCWLWTGSLVHGYGKFSYGSRATRAHRISYELFVGSVPSDKQVLHRCDVRCCVNPAHLFLGTSQENMTDKTQKGRQAKGVGHGMASLTDDQVRDIRAAVGRQRDIAKAFGICQATVYYIKSRKTWTHLEG